MPTLKPGRAVGAAVPPFLAPPQARPAASASAERYLATLGLREARVRLTAEEACVHVDARDLWRVVARRDEVVARLAGLGVRRVTVDLGQPGADDGDAVVFL